MTLADAFPQLMFYPSGPQVNVVHSTRVQQKGASKRLTPLISLLDPARYQKQRNFNVESHIGQQLKPSYLRTL